MIQRLLPIFGTTGLATIAVLLGLALWHQPQVNDTGTKTALEPIQAINNDAAVDAAPAQPRAAVYYAAITERPLFAPDRRPFLSDAAPTTPTTEDAQIAPEPVPEDLPSFQLFGTIIGTGHDRALLASQSDPPRWLRRSESLSGWTIDDIGPNWVMLSRASHSLKLELYPK